ncbi:sigma-70 family RNA polymerase sigma factor [Neisseria animalis]|uniref:Sigma-70 family RNA polymerase sigma factor n=1 Tax=Neisseria animalis TaxID=492 RepID=A0A5P3MT92_NEIAN|nr:sigma-70 family RNA polymerase sigma factor [Neisseria animalis]QEY24680.1 sigma-70 family RNA polymerase sigma factor [Neisseria animalis]ROW31453.1 sigma-70 family RNA polymerase sigma factor [Neisseria animalis]VEE07629.1 RNA polymerase sigma factor [Neisseria animalis]
MCTDAVWDSSNLEKLRRKMLHFAFLQLRNEEWAEDAVQEALTSAYTKQQQFQEGAQWQTWVWAILKNKILDTLRRRQAELQHISPSEEERILDDIYDHAFNDDGHWQPQYRPQAWQMPDEAVRQNDFMRILDYCLEHLPEHTARIFMLREIMGLEVKEICMQTGIGSDNCYTILSRARNGLRLCLQRNWFDDNTGK